MRAATVGLLHPGEMGAALGAVLRRRGQTVVWASAGRSDATAGRADAAGLEDVASTAKLARRSDVILSVCPPHAAGEVARSVGAYDGLFVFPNAIAPATSSALRGDLARYVYGGFLWIPPRVFG